MLRVATYNIHRGRGSDGRLDLARTADLVLSLNADLIALQEVETPALMAARAFLERVSAAGYQPLLGPTIRNERHDYGNVLLSRLPLLDCERVDLSVPGREPRGLLDARFGPLPDGIAEPAGEGARRQPLLMLRCLATHLGLRRSERHRQVARIVAQLKTARLRPRGAEAHELGLDADIEPSPAACSETPILLLGDFNEWHLSSRLRPLARRLVSAPARSSWHAWWPLLALDRIWYRGLSLRSTWVLRGGSARWASDHLPLVADFVAPAPPGRSAVTDRSLEQGVAADRQMLFRKLDAIVWTSCVGR